MPNPDNFAFYDFETTGISPWFDQPIQFSAVLTDADFKEIDRVNFRSRLAPHILPSPKALEVNGVNPEMLNDESLPTFFDYAGQIAETVKKWSPAHWVGYNSMRFDEEFMRQMFYQNLLPEIYATQINGNMRLDIMETAIAARLHDRSLVKIKQNDRGNDSYKLEDVATANGFESENFHDALEDVRATIFVAQRIAESAPEFWKEAVSNADKMKVKGKLESFEPLDWHMRDRWKPPVTVRGCFCGYSADYENYACFLNLGIVGADDMAEFFDMGDDELGKFMKTPEGKNVFRKVAVNKAPPLFAVPNPDRGQAAIAESVEDRPDFRVRVGKAFAAAYKFEARGEQTVEQRIYDGFVDGPDRKLLEDFQQADWPRRKEIADTLADSRLRELGRRLVAMYSPELLSGEERETFDEFIREKWLSDGKVKWTTVGDAMSQIEDMKRGNAAGEKFLAETADFFNSKREQARGGAAEGV